MSTTQELLAANERYDALMKRIEALAQSHEDVALIYDLHRDYRAAARRARAREIRALLESE